MVARSALFLARCAFVAAFTDNGRVSTLLIAPLLDATSEAGIDFARLLDEKDHSAIRSGLVGERFSAAVYYEAWGQLQSGQPGSRRDTDARRRLWGSRVCNKILPDAVDGMDMLISAWHRLSAPEKTLIGCYPW